MRSEVGPEEGGGFVAIVVGFLEEEEVGVVKETAEVMELTAELGRVDGGEGSGLPCRDRDGTVVGVDAAHGVRDGVGEKGDGVVGGSKVKTGIVFVSRLVKNVGGNCTNEVIQGVERDACSIPR